MPSPRFSIVIPTRHGHLTLKDTLLTCIEQDHPSFEIIVSDNQSTEETRKIIEALDFPHIRYFRTPSLLPMTLNFEYAISQAQGEYVLVLGDDDGLIPKALTSIDERIQKTGARAIRWETIYYYWPDMLYERKQNKVLIPGDIEDQWLNGEKMIQDVVNFEACYTFLPMLYHSAVHRDIIRELKARSGSVYKSRSPDLHSGFAVAYMVKDYLYVGSAMSIMGVSQKSNGWAHMMNDSQAIAEYETLNAQQKISCHPEVPNIHSLYVAILDSFRYAKDSLFPERNDLSYDEKCMIVNAYITAYNFTHETENLQRLREVLREKPGLLKWFESKIVPNLSLIREHLNLDSPKNFMSPSVIVANVAETLDIHRLYDVSKIMYLIRHYQKEYAIST